MKRLFALIFLAIFLLFAGCEESANSEVNSDINSTCDLNKKSCEIPYKGGNIVVSLNPKPIASMIPLTLTIDGLEGNFTELNAHFNGLNMDMGTIVARLERRGSAYVANVVISSCVVQEMLYRLELFDGKKAIGAHIDFVLRS